jgi:hypothetical protein
MGSQTARTEFENADNVAFIVLGLMKGGALLSDFIRNKLL